MSLILLNLLACTAGPAIVTLDSSDDSPSEGVLAMRFGTALLPDGVNADLEELADRQGDTTTVIGLDGARQELTWKFGDVTEVYSLLKEMGADVEPFRNGDRGFGAVFPDDGGARCVYISGQDGVVLFQSHPVAEDADCANFEDEASLATIETVHDGFVYDDKMYSAWGTSVGTYGGVIAYSNGSNSYVGPYSTYGYQYQCVEYVNRYFVVAKGKANMRGSGNANAYCSGRSGYGVTVYTNGTSTTSPATGDFVASTGGTYGHVAIVNSVSASAITVIQQNWSNSSSDASKSLTLSTSSGKYTVGTFSASYPVACWGR